jgi:hypothetical protein
MWRTLSVVQCHRVLDYSWRRQSLADEDNVNVEVDLAGETELRTAPPNLSPLVSSPAFNTAEKQRGAKFRYDEIRIRPPLEDKPRAVLNHPLRHFTLLPHVVARSHSRMETLYFQIYHQFRLSPNRRRSFLTL